MAFSPHDVTWIPDYMEITGASHRRVTCPYYPLVPRGLSLVVAIGVLKVCNQTIDHGRKHLTEDNFPLKRPLSRDHTTHKTFLRLSQLVNAHIHSKKAEIPHKYAPNGLGTAIVSRGM